jgi:peroxiredoxin Q/BCP
MIPVLVITLMTSLKRGRRSSAGANVDRQPRHPGGFGRQLAQTRSTQTKEVQPAPALAAKPRIAVPAPGIASSVQNVPTPIRAGLMAPDFELQDENGARRRLSSFRGMPVVLYFYPADDTLGCTKEACNFRDDYSTYKESGVTILGISPDTVRSHTKFKTKYGLQFPLLADLGHQLCSMYGVWGRKKFMGGSMREFCAPPSHRSDRPNRSMSLKGAARRAQRKFWRLCAASESPPACLMVGIIQTRSLQFRMTN